MSLTVFVKMEDGKAHDVDLGGLDTVKDLYRKAAKTSGVEVGTFLLHFEGEELDDTFSENEVQQLGMWEGCELLLCCNVHNTMCVSSQELSSEDTRKAMGRRLEEDPDLLLQVEASGVKCLRLHTEYFPSGLRHLRVTDPGQCVTSIGSDFLHGCTSLVTLDLTSLQCVRVVGLYFLSRCKSLQAIDLAPFHNIKKLEFGFLSYCESLTLVDLGPLQNVTEVDQSFMSSCKSLQTLDVGPLRNVTVIGNRFLSNCTSLTSVDFGLPGVVSVGDYFLSNCTSLTSVDLSAMRNLKRLGSGFLCDCRSLTTVDFGDLRERVTVVGEHYYCDNVPLGERKRPRTCFKCCVVC